jgi:hypothetical protein
MPCAAYRVAEYRRPDYVLLHISVTRRTGRDGFLYGAVDAGGRLGDCSTN